MLSKGNARRPPSHRVAGQGTGVIDELAYHAEWLVKLRHCGLNEDCVRSCVSRWIYFAVLTPAGNMQDVPC